MLRRFATLDVFTDKPFTGNPLAVVLEPEGLDAGAMQAIAREFNLSETVFVFPPANTLNRAKLRIFTPARELPFAGHPTVGTAVLLGLRDRPGAGSAFILEEQIGPVPCRVTSHSATRGRASFDVPKLPSKQAGPPPAAAMAPALGLAAADLGLDGLPTECWSAGNPFTFVPVSGLDAMARCAVDVARFGDAFDSAGGAAFVFCRETRTAGHAFHARMFAPAFGVLEDPATGSAVAAFAGYLAAHGGYADGTHVISIEQGYEMGRPSLLELTIVIKTGALTGASIAGNAVVVMEGSIEA